MTGFSDFVARSGRICKESGEKLTKSGLIWTFYFEKSEKLHMISKSIFDPSGVPQEEICWHQTTAAKPNDKPKTIRGKIS